MKTETITITARAKNLGYASNSTPTRDGRMLAPTSPHSLTDGVSLLAVERAYFRDARLYSGGTFWASALFVGGRRVVDIDVRTVIDLLRYTGSVELDVEVHEVVEAEPRYTTRGSVRGGCGHSHRTEAAARTCIERDHRGCKSQGGYSDRRVVEVEL